jgi:hypothetical protein
MLLLASGEPFGDVQREVENGLEFTRKVRFGLFADIMNGWPESFLRSAA